MLQTNNSGVCSQCLSHAGHAPAHGAHRSGSMSLRQELSEAGPRLHAPPQSKPYRLGSQVALRGADSVGPAFGPFPGPSSSALGERGRCDSSPFPSLLPSFLGVQQAPLLRRMVTVQNPKKS